jgi:hypothetical protein
MSRILQGLCTLRGLFQRFQHGSRIQTMPSAPSQLTPPRPQPISVEMAVPAHMVAAVTEELHLRVQRILQRAVDEERGLPPQSALLVMGVRVDSPADEVRLLH